MRDFMAKQTYGLVRISAEAQKTLLEDVYRRRDIEACGLLLGCMDEQGHWHIEQAHPLRNIYHSPAYFEFAPEELLEAELAFPGKIVGVYHSHPSGYARASQTDRDNMRRVNVEQHIPWVWLIIRGPFNGKYRPLSTIAYHHYQREGLREIAVDIDRESKDN
jgi:proteasome lid subunit RPN8/RPN11